MSITTSDDIIYTYLFMNHLPEGTRIEKTQYGYTVVAPGNNAGTNSPNLVDALRSELGKKWELFALGTNSIDN